MSEKFVNQTDLNYYHGRIKSLFATQTALDALDDRVDEIVSEGGEPNTINSVSVNGTAIAPDAQKNIAITVPTQTSQLTNNGDGTSNFATESYVAANGGKIDKIKVNGTEQTIDSADKSVNVVVPTTVAELSDASNYALASSVPSAVSDLTNDAGYQTASDVSSAISTAVSSAYKYKGSVATLADLPASADTGDVYDVQATGMNYAWNGSAWDALGQLVDTSVLWNTTDLVAMTTAEIDAIIDAS